MKRDFELLVIDWQEPPVEALTFLKGFGSPWRWIRLEELPDWRRALSGFVRGEAASYAQYSGKRATTAVRSAIEAAADASLSEVICEDVPSLVAAAAARAHRFHQVDVILRSHNVAADIFGSGFEFGGVEGTALALEARLLRKTEGDCLRQMADVLWCISGDDTVRYRDLYGVEADGVIDVFIEGGWFKSAGLDDVVPDEKCVVYVGGTDRRKRHGLDRFLGESWPVVLDHHSEARLILAGSGTKRYSDQERRVDGLGYVEDVSRVIRRGTVFVNPQEIGSGLKLKSIVAMWHGAPLVTTSEGARGLPERVRRECVIVEDALGLGPAIAELLANPTLRTRLGEQGRAEAREYYGRETFLNRGRAVIGRSLADP